MVRVIDRGIKTGKELGYSSTFPETARMKYRHYLVGNCLEIVSIPVQSDLTIQQILSKYYPENQIEIVK